MTTEEREELESLARLLSESDGKPVKLSKVVRKCLEYGKSVLLEELQPGTMAPGAAKSDTARIHTLFSKVLENGLRALNLPST